jgi:hypothetical protein
MGRYMLKVVIGGLGAINSHRLQHGGQEELTQQTLSAAKLPLWGWQLDYWKACKQSGSLCSCRFGFATYFATQPETEIDIQIG